jgi:hypothetical protein
MWHLNSEGLPLGHKTYGVNPQDPILWACFNPYETGSGTPFLVGRPGQEPTWERDYRPMIKKGCGLGTKRLALLSEKRTDGRWVNIRDLKSKRMIGSVLLAKEERMLWSNHGRLFVVYWGSKRVEMIRLNRLLSFAGRFESVSLILPNGL